MTGCCCTSSKERASFSQTRSEIERCRSTSKEFDEETGLYYMSARYMNPVAGGWMSSDPKGWELLNPMEKNQDGKLTSNSNFSIIESSNWYSYVGNNPIKFVDPNGKQSRMPTFSGMLTFYLNHSTSGDATLIKAAQGNEQAQAVVGAEPVAAGAATVASTADLISAGLNISADAIEGEISSDTVGSLSAVAVDQVGGRFLPGFNSKSGRFHKSFGTGRGQFVKDKIGRAAMAFSATASKTASFIGGLFGGGDNDE
jgi:RHS repeat-associated protein